MYQSFKMIMSLVRRDYAVQYAGTSLGIFWVIVQYFFQIGMFWLIFGVLFQAVMPVKAGIVSAEMDYLSYLLAGMGLWLPLSEMLLRSCGILVENRALIRRTAIGMKGFLYMPLAEAIIHYLLVMSVITGIGILRGQVGFMFPLGLAFGICVLIFFAGWSFVFARIGVILKDISPLMRLFLQIVFWSTPFVYPAFTKWEHIFAMNPLHSLVSIHRALLYSQSISLDAIINLPVFFVFMALSLVVFGLSSLRMGPLVGDHL